MKSCACVRTIPSSTTTWIKGRNTRSTARGNPAGPRACRVYFLSLYQNQSARIMSLQEQVMEQIKAAMKARDTVSLESLRAIKSALLLMQTDKGGVKTLSEAEEIALVQKLVKQRRESASIFQEQGRADLAEAELQQIAVMERFLPEQLSEAEVGQEVARAIASLGAKDLKDMGRVMGEVTRTLAGRADGKLIAALVRSQLGQ